MQACAILYDMAANQERQRAGDQIEAAIAERLKLALLGDEDQAECRRLVEALEAQTADRRGREARVVELEKKLEQSRSALRQKEREFGRDVAMLKSALAAAHAARASAVAGDEKQELEAITLRLQAATAEQERLQALVAEHEGDRERIAADRQAAVDTLQQSLARTREEAALDIEQSRQALADLEVSKHAALAELVAQLAQTSAEQARLAARVEAAERELDCSAPSTSVHTIGLVAEHQRALADVQTGTRDELEALERRLQAAAAEHGRLQALVEEDAVDRERIAADHRAAVDTLQQSLARAREDAALQVEQSRQALAESRSALAQSLAEQSGIAERVEEQTREQDLIRAEHHRALADVETSKREALDELPSSQLSQAVVDQRRLASHADEQELELNRLRAEHQAALTDTETRYRDALAEWRRELAQTAERAEQHEHERDRISAEHALAIADLQAGNEAAAAELRSKLSDAVAEHHRLTALLEEHDRERERLAAEHRRAIADLQASKQETVAECERVLTEVHQALLVRDTSRHLEIERRLIDGIDEGPQMKVDGDRLVALQRGLTQAFSQMQVVFKDEPAPKQPLEAEPERAEDADLLHEPFDDADDAFIQQLLEGTHANRVPETHPDPKAGGPAHAVSGMPALKTDDQPADDMFDANDATFARRLMDTPGPLPRSAEEDS